MKKISFCFFLFISMIMVEFSIADLTQSEIDQILDLHNQYRAQVNPSASNMVKIAWDTTVASVAQSYANTCPTGHSGSSYGENLAWGWPSRTVQSAINSWYGEVQYYNYASNSCSGTCGHYTQIIWANSVKLGCGKTTCPNLFGNGNGDAIVCNYSPPGNYIGQKPFQSGTSCSSCPTGYPICDNGLCSSSAQSTTSQQTTGTIPSQQTTGTIPSQQTTGTIPSQQTTGTIPSQQTTGTIPSQQTTDQPTVQTTEQQSVTEEQSTIGPIINSQIQQSSKNNAGTIAGAVVGVILGMSIIAGVIILIFFIYRKRNSNVSHTGTYHSNINLEVKPETPILISGPAIDSPVKSSPPAQRRQSPPVQRPQSPTTQRRLPSPSPQGFSIGANVQSKFSGDGRFYKAVIVDIANGQYLVQYPDYQNSQEWRTIDCLKY